MRVRLSRARQLIAAATALPLIVGAGFGVLVSTSGARAETCEDAVGLAVLSSPLAPWKGAPVARHFRHGKAA